jgi:hypothetical protein
MAGHIDPNLQAAVERLVRKQFPDAVIDSVNVKRAVDADGDDILDVVVIFAEAPTLSGISGLTRKLWGEISDRDRDAGFPILSFRTAAENAYLSAAA